MSGSPSLIIGSTVQTLLVSRRTKKVTFGSETGSLVSLDRRVDVNSPNVRTNRRMLPIIVGHGNETAVSPLCLISRTARWCLKTFSLEVFELASRRGCADLQSKGANEDGSGEHRSVHDADVPMMMIEVRLRKEPQLFESDLPIYHLLLKHVGAMALAELSCRAARVRVRQSSTVHFQSQSARVTEKQRTFQEGCISLLLCDFTLGDDVRSAMRGKDSHLLS